MHRKGEWEKGSKERRRSALSQLAHGVKASASPRPPSSPQASLPFCAEPCLPGPRARGLTALSRQGTKIYAGQ